AIRTRGRAARLPAFRPSSRSFLRRHVSPMAESFPIARTSGGVDILFSPAVANRHVLITGATGTGKTVSLQVLADHFSAIGVPVFLSDVKGDLTGLAAAGSLTP